jgi:hypothetical protein
MNNVSLCPERFRTAAKHGLTVFPLKPRSSEPLNSRWRGQALGGVNYPALDASDSNVGVLCGPETGICVLNVDNWAAQQVILGLNLSDTPMVMVEGREGFQLYYRDVGFPLTSSFLCGPGRIHLIGHENYVVGAGSIDELGNEYTWMIDPSEAPFPELPRVFLEAYSDNWATHNKVKGLEHRPVPSELYLAGDVHDTCLSIALGQVGTRDDLLVKNALRLAQASVLDRANLEWDCIAGWMTNAAAYAGLDRVQVEAQLQFVGELVIRKASLEPA